MMAARIIRVCNSTGARPGPVALEGAFEDNAPQFIFVLPEILLCLKIFY